jgi:hypothetical protein
MRHTGAIAATRPHIVFRFPVIGAMLQDAVFGHEDAKYYFIANVLITVFWIVFLFGYPALIMIALMGAAGMFALIITMTSLDLIENRKKKPVIKVSALNYRPEKK